MEIIKFWLNFGIFRPPLMLTFFVEAGLWTVMEKSKAGRRNNLSRQLANSDNTGTTVSPYSSRRG